MTRQLIVQLALLLSLHAVDPVLIVDGRNNHDWIRTTASLKSTLLATGRFSVDVATAPEDKLGPPPRKPPLEDADYREAKVKYDALAASLRSEMDAAWAHWAVDFSKYRAVILNYNGPDWPQPMKTAFVNYLRSGGGVLLIHAANNAFASWPEFNEAIGLGWRKGVVGRCLVINQAGAVEECCQGEDSGHGAKHPFVVTNRVPEHPVLRGMPAEWMHARDELYHHMRGPANNVKILASAYSDESQRGTGRNEPVLWEVEYGRGRVLVCTMGHLWQGDEDQDSLHCVGFQSILARSVEYLSAGEVTLPLPAPLPTKTATSIIEPAKAWSLDNRQSPPRSSTPFTPLTPQQQQRTFVMADGLVAECIAAEPLVEQPVLTVWDGNGAMYVAEMRSYMQDENGTGTKTLKNGRIKKLTDSNGDGIMDRATVFVDGLNLPRMILALDDRIAVQETDDTSVWSYRDRNNDGVADEKVLLFNGVKGDGTKSVEHQPSGLDWNLDNYIYVSYAKERYRFTDGTWKSEALHPIWSQWGITHDDVGRVYYSDNSTPAMGFEVGRQYWLQIKTRAKDSVREGEPIPLGLPWDMSFLAAKNICETDDRGGQAPARKIFTSACGQSIYRGDALPEMRGDYFVCDPSIHVVRRAKIVRTNGQTKFLSAYGNEEFMLSPEIFFRQSIPPRHPTAV